MRSGNYERSLEEVAQLPCRSKIHRIHCYRLCRCLDGQEDSLAQFLSTTQLTGERYLRLINNDVLPLLLELPEFNEQHLIW